MNVSTKSKTTPIQDSFQKVGKNYPDKLILYKIESSSYWWVRYFSSKSGKRKIHRRSTKEKDLSLARDFAKNFYENILLEERNNPIIVKNVPKSKLYKSIWNDFFQEQVSRLNRGELHETTIKNLRSESKEILKALGDYPIQKIDYRLIDELVTKLNKKGLSSGSIKKYLQNIRGVLKLAYREDLITKIPLFPTIKRKDNPRSWFSESDYDKLRETTKKIIKSKVVVRGHQIDDEIRLFITFLVNTFLRPPDVKFLKHRNIEVIKDNEKYLRIQTDSSKTTRNAPVISMENGIYIYADIKKFQNKMDRPTDAEDFVFLPHIKNRDSAYRILQRQFNYILKESNLQFTSNGEKRTVYSLRHTAISFRLLLGDVDLLTLSNTARTSVDMIQRFYASHLNAEMNVDKLQSFRKK